MLFTGPNEEAKKSNFYKTVNILNSEIVLITFLVQKKLIVL